MTLASILMWGDAPLAAAAQDARASAGPPDARGGLETYRVVGDSIPDPLGGMRGDAASGQRIVVDREVGNCLICHAAPNLDEPFQGEIGPPLAGVGSRLSEGQIRLRLVDQSRLNPATLMPPYYRIHGLINVAPQYRGRPALTAQQVEDVVAYLASLRDQETPDGGQAQ